MCGIVGYIGNKDISSILLVGLERLSYRGYDSSGIALISDQELSVWKRTGKIHELSKLLKPMSISGRIGIGHTRWATHGTPVERNAHPHLSSKRKIAVVHNGIIENYLSLKRKLIEAGHIFRSETDSEVIAHLIEEYYDGDLVAAVSRACKDLEGSFAIAVLSELHPDQIVAVRNGSPLIIGVGEQETHVSSDINSIIPHTKDVIYMNDYDLAVVTQHSVSFQDLEGNELQREMQSIKWSAEMSDKKGYPNYMFKEIHEQPSIVRKILDKHVTDQHNVEFKYLKDVDTAFKSVNRLIIQACGTSWHAGLYGKYLIEKYSRVPTETDVSSEFRYRHIPKGSNEMVIALSQSGETADTLACLREAKSKFFHVLSFVNVKGSSMARESDSIIYTHAGPEIGVASTKNYVAQLLNMYLFSLYLGKLKGFVTEDEMRARLEDVQSLPSKIEAVLSNDEHIQAIAKKYMHSKSYLFIGRQLNYPTALEGALKLKEISYIHAAGYAAGELKHGPIALIDENMPVVCLSPPTSTYSKMVSNIEEVKAREGRLIILGQDQDPVADLADDFIPLPSCSEDLSPILAAIPLQLLAYYTAMNLGCNVDQPRNLAKSVTVE